MATKKTSKREVSDQLYSLAILIAVIIMIVLSAFVITKKTTGLGAPTAPKTLPQHYDDFKDVAQ